VLDACNETRLQVTFPWAVREGLRPATVGCPCTKAHNASVTGRNKAVASAAAAAAVVGGGAAKFGDDAARALRGTPDSPPIGGILDGGVVGAAPHVGGAVDIRSQLETFVATVGDGITATPEAARDAALSSACGVLYIAVTEARLPTDAEWVAIAIDATSAAAVDVPVGSGGWRELERVKDEVADTVSDSLGYVDDTEANSVADELSCAWA